MQAVAKKFKSFYDFGNKILISPGNQCHIDKANVSCRPNDDIPSVMISLDDYASPAVAGRYRLKFSICLKNGVFFNQFLFLIIKIITRLSTIAFKKQFCLKKTFGI